MKVDDKLDRLTYKLGIPQISLWFSGEYDYQDINGNLDHIEGAISGLNANYLNRLKEST